MTNSLVHDIPVINRGHRTVIKIRLNDECKNGHEDFSLTASICKKNEHGSWIDVGGGCCHEHILKLRPDLKMFADLHLCTWQGIPMHCASNAFYWLAGHLDLPYVDCHGSSGSCAKSKDECLKIFIEHVRCTEDELPTLLACRSSEELQIAIEDLGIVARWRSEADLVIKQLEEWTGKTFESAATRGFWEPVSQEVRALAASRKASGYYTPEAIAARDKQKLEDKKAKKRKALASDRDKAVLKADKKLELELFMLNNFTVSNWIYYDHTNELAVNWTSTEKLVTKEEYAEMEQVLAVFQTAMFPEGIKLRWQERPKY